MTDINDYYSNQNQINNKTITTRFYLNRLTALQVFSTSVIFISSCLQAVAIGTTEWFVLNVNEYIPTSKGGLWDYCYVSGTGMMGINNCQKYENLPNFAVFVNSRLYDSRVLLLCSSGFCLLILIIEIFGIICLSCAESRGDLFDTLIAKNSNTFRTSKSSPNLRTKSLQTSKIIAPINQNELTSSARFTTSIIVNTGPPSSTVYKTVKPTGYFTYLTIALITLIGSVMEFVLKVSGFALFDSYINRLLSLNTVFLAYRSYSYWMIVVSMGLTVFFWLYKVFTTRYVINLTKILIQDKDKISSVVYTESLPQLDQLKNYTTVSKVNAEDDTNKSDNYNIEQSYDNFPIQTKFIYDLESNEDDFSSSNFSRQQSRNSNYYHEYLQKEPKSPKQETRSVENKSIISVVRF